MTPELLTLDRLLDRAREEAALQDFGALYFLPQLRSFVASVNEIADRLHPEGRARLERSVVRLLVNRLRLHRDLAAHPAIAAEPLAPPVAIIGLPRTGSTRLQRILSAGGAHQELLMWQAYNPAPFDDSQGAGPDPRIAAAAEFVGAVAEHAPDSHKGHMMVVEGVEEESHLLEQTFQTPTTISFFPVFSWCRSIERIDKTDMYQHLRTCLQYLQWQFRPGDPRPWLLKYPANLGNETYLSRIFPDTRYIVTHRDPMRVLASLSQLIASTQLLNCQTSSTAECANWAFGEFSAQMDRHLAWRESHPEAQVIDIAYRDIVADGMGVSRRIHDFLGVELTSESSRHLQVWLREDEQRHERLEYDLNAIPFSAAECRQRFAAYHERFAAFL